MPIIAPAWAQILSVHTFRGDFPFFWPSKTSGYPFRSLFVPLAEQGYSQVERAALKNNKSFYLIMNVMNAM